MKSKLHLVLENFIKNQQKLAAIFLLSFSGIVFAQNTLLSDNFNGTVPTYSSPYLSTNSFVDGGITATGLVRGAGITGLGGTANFYATRNWTPENNLGTAKTNNDYIEFTITPLVTKLYDLNEISFQVQRANNNNSPKRFTLVALKESGEEVSIGNKFLTGTTVTNFVFSGLLNISSLTNIDQRVRFRLYGYDGAAAAFRILNYTVNGAAKERPTITSTTSIWASRCNATLPALDTPIYSNSVYTADRIRFKISVPGTSQEEIIEKPMSGSTFFKITDLQTLPVNFETTYNVSVQYRRTINSYPTWSPYGETCSVTTPAIVTTQIWSSLCNTTLSSLETSIYSVSVNGATAIRFKVALANDPNIVEVIEKPMSGSTFFKITDLQTLPVSFDTAYLVSVSYHKSFYGRPAEWSKYGTVCSVTTPSIPTTQIWSSLCNTTLSSLETSIYSVSVNGATAIRFKVALADNPQQEEIIEKISSNSAFFKLTELQTLPVEAGKIYLVSVQYQKDFYGRNYWSNYGAVCNVTTPGGAAPLVAETEIVSRTADSSPVHVKAYPNPFASEFNLALDQTGEAKITVYDQSGRLIENQLLSPGSDVRFGSNYASGVYMVHVNQNHQTYFIRVIKR